MVNSPEPFNSASNQPPRDRMIACLDVHYLDPRLQAKAAAVKVDQRIAGRSQSVPMKLDPACWYNLVVEIVGDEMHVTLDGQSVGFLKSSDWRIR